MAVVGSNGATVMAAIEATTVVALCLFLSSNMVMVDAAPSPYLIQHNDVDTTTTTNNAETTTTTTTTTTMTTPPPKKIQTHKCLWSDLYHDDGLKNLLFLLSHQIESCPNEIGQTVDYGIEIGINGYLETAETNGAGDAYELSGLCYIHWYLFLHYQSMQCDDDYYPCNCCKCWAQTFGDNIMIDRTRINPDLLRRATLNATVQRELSRRLSSANDVIVGKMQSAISDAIKFDADDIFIKYARSTGYDENAIKLARLNYDDKNFFNFPTDYIYPTIAQPNRGANMSEIAQIMWGIFGIILFTFIFGCHVWLLYKKCKTLCGQCRRQAAPNDSDDVADQLIFKQSSNGKL